MANQGETTGMQVIDLGLGEAVVPIVGLTELICDNWSLAAINEIESKQMGKATRKKDPIDPDVRLRDSIYTLPDGSYGFPATGFKTAIVDACRSFENVTMVAARVGIQVEPDGFDTVHGKPLVRIVGEPRMRRDVARAKGTAMLRYRAGFPAWSAVLTIKFDPTLIPAEILVNLVNAAGRGGVGNWRPSSPESKSGWAGTFRADVR